jgi:hypothetical protein
MNLFENTPLDRTRHAFSQQFEAEGQGYLYRLGQRGAAYLVSDEERNTFVNRYTFQIYGLAFLLVGGILGIVFAVGTYTDQMASPPSDETIVTDIIACFAALIVLYFMVAQWIWKAPARALSRRSAVRMDRSTEAAVEAKYSKISWGQLGLGVFAIGFLIFKFGQKYDLTQGPGLIFTGLIALGSIILIWQIAQKLRRG